jgi:hypothetical protein
MAEVKVVDETHHISKRRGNGLLRREVWTDAAGHVVRYNLAYINHEQAHGDNGRVVGYDNHHGYHHRHHLGKVSAVEFTSFEDIEALFEADWLALRK